MRDSFPVTLSVGEGKTIAIMGKGTIALQLIQQYYFKAEQIIDLLRRVTTVSVETMKIIKEMP